MNGKNKELTKIRDWKKCKQNKRRRRTGKEGENRELI
jgi:hypothetical protein